MKLLKICRNFLDDFFSTKKEIPSSIDDKEILVRCIGHNLYYNLSKKRLASTAFMPPPRENEVSLLRLGYTDANACKKHAKSIKKGDYIYCGLSITSAIDLLEAPSKCASETPKYSDGTEVHTKIISTPLDIDKKKRVNTKVYISDEGLPAHADLIYNWTPEQGKNAPNSIKKVAKYLSKNPPTFFFADEDVNSEMWCGKELKK